MDLSLRLTLIVLLCRPMDPWPVSVGMMLIAVAGLVHAPLLHARAMWLAVAALVVWHLASEWPFPDNHHYLLAYWTLGIGIALGMPVPSRALAHTARLLIGVAFLLAVIWKGVLSTDYRDGRFFTTTLLTDDRFEAVVQLAGGLTTAQLAEARAYLAPLPEGAELLVAPTWPDAPQLRVLVTALTWGGLALELALATLWLVPFGGTRVAMARHAALLVFCVLTYALAPVAGFGWLLLAMGLSVTDPAQRRLRAIYVAAFGLVLVFSEVAWTSLLLDLRS